MAAPKRTAFQIERDRRDIADLYLQGWTQARITQHINDSEERDYQLSARMIGYDLKAIQTAWQASALVDIDAAKARELAKVDRLEREYWDAWERSCEDAETSAQTTRGKVTKYEGANGVFVYERPADLTKTQHKRDGDPRFLAGVQWCIERRCKILGIDAPTKLQSEHSGTVLFDVVEVGGTDLVKDF